MSERIESIDLGVRWDPNAPEAVLVTDDAGRTVLAVDSPLDEPDDRCIVLVWTGTRQAQMGDPNDEALEGHRLYERGLKSVLWAGIVIDSELVKSLERQNSVHDRHDPAWFRDLVHYVLPLKSCVVEVVAEGIEVRRVPGHTAAAALAALA